MSEEYPLASRQEIRIQDWSEVQTEEYSDGSRLHEAAAAGTTRTAEYLGGHATVMDAEMVGVCLAIETRHNKIALDSQAAIIRAV